MRAKKYLQIDLRDEAGNLPYEWSINLKLSEAYIVSRVAQQYPKHTLEVRLIETNEGHYKSLFG